MDEVYVAQFLTTYFTGIEDIDFFLFFKHRTVMITFQSEEAWEENLTKEKMQTMADLFLLDKPHLQMMVDRDSLETVMFFTAAQGAMTALIEEYSKANKPQMTDEIKKEIERRKSDENEKEN